MVVMKLDVLDDLPKIKICAAYRHRGKRYEHFPADIELLNGAEPIYEELPGWQESTRAVRKWNRLPRKAQAYLKRIASLAQVPISIVSVGSNRSETIFLHGTH
jgi:adenylosuccinate synthase